MTGTARCLGDDGKCEVSFFQPIWGDYEVMDTDYENYSVVYSCTSFLGLASTQIAWVLGRRETLEDEYVQTAKDIIDGSLNYFTWDDLV